MLIHSFLLLWAIIQGLTHGSPTYSQPCRREDPPLCKYAGFEKCQETGVKTMCINLCTDHDLCHHIDTHKCTEASVLAGCPQKCHPPVIGGWSAWLPWGSCSLLCPIGKRIRSRRCDNPKPANGGSPCQGVNYEKEDCTSPHCITDGGWSAWLPWGSCSLPCGGGKRSRSRLCDKPLATNGGSPCPGVNYEEGDCNLHPCIPKDCPPPWFVVLDQCFMGVGGRSKSKNKSGWLDWHSARDYCRAQHLSGKLAEPRNIQALADFLKPEGQRNGYWIGGSDLIKEGEWRWINGRGLVPNAWAKDEPSRRNTQNCLGIFSKHGAKSLRDYMCSEKAPFVCERDL